MASRAERFEKRMKQKDEEEAAKAAEAAKRTREQCPTGTARRKKYPRRVATKTNYTKFFF